MTFLPEDVQPDTRPLIVAITTPADPMQPGTRLYCGHDPLMAAEVCRMARGAHRGTRTSDRRWGVNTLNLAINGPLGGVTKQRPRVLHAITLESGADGCMNGRTVEAACGKKRVFFVSDADGCVLLWPPPAKGVFERCAECWEATGKKRPRKLPQNMDRCRSTVASVS